MVDNLTFHYFFFPSPIALLYARYFYAEVHYDYCHEIIYVTKYVTLPSANYPPITSVGSRKRVDYLERKTK